MNIPINNALTQVQRDMLEKLGFDFNTVEKFREMNSIRVPDTDRFSCTKKQRTFDICDYEVGYNGILVLSITACFKFYDRNVKMHFHTPAIEYALGLDNSYIPSPKKVSQKPTELPSDIADDMETLVRIVYDDGIYRLVKLEDTLTSCLNNLNNYQKTNRIEHDEIINSNQRYTHLRNAFKNWSFSNLYEELLLQAKSPAAYSFVFHGELFQTTASYFDPSIDFQLGENPKPFTSVQTAKSNLSSHGIYANNSTKRPDSDNFCGFKPGFLL